MRGEYHHVHSHAVSEGGSSPHAWGILVCQLSKADVRRFIPTCVGNTGCAQAPQGLMLVHPHMRGEYQHRARFFGRHDGSSPHAWGIRVSDGPDDLRRRFIPTCVGNTATSSSRWLMASVHPHMRGEYALKELRTMERRGSSPHAWGIREAGHE